MEAKKQKRTFLDWVKDTVYTARNRGPFDRTFAVLVVILLTIGVITVLSSSYATAYYERKDNNAVFYFSNQLRFAIGGLGLMLAVTLVPKQWIFRLTPVGYLISVVLLLLVLAVGTTINGAKRWLGNESFGFQPSEIAKLGMILMMSYMGCVRARDIRTFQSFLWMAGTLLLILGLVIAEKHISASVILLGVGGVIMLASGCNKPILILAAVLGILVLWYVINHWDYAIERLKPWRDPEAEDVRMGTGWQVRQSLYAIGSGGLLGQGMGQSRQKYLYLPEESNDYILSIFCEEMGFLGAAILIALFALLVIRGYWLAMHARDRFSALVIVGITTLVALETVLNVLVVTNTAPPTGISLPFFSYGGTALILQLFEMGIVLNLSRDIPMPRDKAAEMPGEAEEAA